MRKGRDLMPWPFGAASRLQSTYRLTARRPVVVPMALGWSSHFGLGLFLLGTPKDERPGG